MSELSRIDQIEKEMLERKVRAGWGGFTRNSEAAQKCRQEASVALIQLRKSEWWKQSHPDNWEGYCLEVLDLNPRQARRLMETAPVIEVLSRKSDEFGRLSIAAAEALAGLDEATIVATFEEVTANGQKATKENILAILERMKQGAELTDEEMEAINDENRQDEDAPTRGRPREPKDFIEIVLTKIRSLERQVRRGLKDKEERERWQAWIEEGKSLAKGAETCAA